MIDLRQETVALIEQKYAVTNMEMIDKGWSGDKKYRVDTADGASYLLRITPEESFDGYGIYVVREMRYKRQTDIFHLQQSLAALDIPMCRPVEYGRCSDGIYSIQTWIDGKDAEDVIPRLSDAQQYAYGLEAGKILKTLHSVPVSEDQIAWEHRFNAETARRVTMYHECPVQFDGAEELIAYIDSSRYLLSGRPQLFQHGDYRIGNMMLENDRIVIIDFDQYAFGDPWEEFSRITSCARISPLFASGMINGYFDDEVPEKFWKLLALYVSSRVIGAIPQAIPFGDEEVDAALEQAREVSSWYNHMKNTVPSWYSKGYYLQYIDGLPYKMKAYFDFAFIHEYGKVFKVYDDQDSGNICFGVYGKDDGTGETPRYFVKFAGAPTERYDGTPEDAIARLKATVPIYRDLAHPCLTELVEAREIAGGYVMVFKWAEGDCMGRMYPEEHRRIMSLPKEARLQIFRDVLVFLEHVHEQGYVAIDFYDGSVMYSDTANSGEGKTTICDIDLFCRKPYRNDMGRMWGSSHFMSPEEFKLGAEIDEITNVYTAGALALALFGAYGCHRETWTLGEMPLRVARRAVSRNRSDRQQSIRQLAQEWEKGLKASGRKLNQPQERRKR